MTRQLLASIAALVALAAPAHADDMERAWGLSTPQVTCLIQHIAPSPQGHDPEAIARCNITGDRLSRAMDFVMGQYIHTRGNNGPEWVKAHCHAEPAIPRNKWVCTDGPYGGETREYR